MIRHMTKENSTSNEARPLTETELEEIIKALANPARREILAWLRTPEQYFADQAYPLEMGVCAGKIFEKTGLSHSTASAHLASLQRAGLVSTRKIGQWIFYSRNEAVIAAFLHKMQHEL